MKINLNKEQSDLLIECIEIRLEDIITKLQNLDQIPLKKYHTLTNVQRHVRMNLITDLARKRRDVKNLLQILK